MIRVGFMLSPGKGWLGGVNYFKNLFFAIDFVNDNGMEFLVFSGEKSDKNIFDEILKDKKSIRFIKTPLLDRYSLLWFFWRLSRRLLGSDVFAHYVLAKHEVSVFSHSNMTSSRLARAINWIPDFQHLHLPEFFPEEEVGRITQSFLHLIENSNATILSSQAAFNDFCRFSPANAVKGHVVRFVSQPSATYWRLTDDDGNSLKGRYKITGRYFYLPNQFWKHKNHEVVFRAVKLLLDQGIDITVVCTGSMSDHRNPEYRAYLESLIEESGISRNIRLLGIIPYDDVYGLMRFSDGVINPSLFEGWSSTVEECKSVGKRLILSDIQVHREQTDKALFFSPRDEQGLAVCIRECLDIAEISDVESNSADLHERTRAFGSAYIKVVSSIL